MITLSRSNLAKHCGNYNLPSFNLTYKKGNAVLVEISRVENILNWGLEENESPPSLNDLLQNRNVRCCLYSKQKIYGETLLKKNHLFKGMQIFYVFSLWIIDLCSIYKATYPEAEEIEAELLHALCNWRYFPKNNQARSEFLERIRQLQIKLEEGLPNYSKTNKVWEALLVDECKEVPHHWDWDFTYNEIEQMLAQGSKNDTTCFIITKLEETQLESLWKKAISAFKKTSELVLKILLEPLEEIYKEMNEVDKVNFYRATNLPGRDGWNIFNQFRNKLPSLIQDIEKISMQTKDWEAAEKVVLAVLAEVIKLIGDVDGFTDYILDVNPDIKDLKMIFISNKLPGTDSFVRLFFNYKETIQKTHRLIDTLIVSEFKNIVLNLFYGLKYNGIQSQEFKRKTEEADKVRDEILRTAPKKIIPPKPKRKQQSKPKASSTPAIVVKRPPIKKESISTISLIDEVFSDEIKSTARHVDLLRQAIPGSTGLNKLISPLTLRRICYHSAHQLLEAALNLRGQCRGVPGEILRSHNLWTKAKVMELKEIPEAVKELYLASYWARFPKEQRKLWRSLETDQEKEPLVLTAILDEKAENMAETRSRLDKTIKALDTIFKGIFPVENHVYFGALPYNHQPLEPWTGEIPSIFNHPPQPKPNNEYLSQWINDMKEANEVFSAILKTTDRSEYILLLNHLGVLVQNLVEVPLRWIHFKKLGIHTSSHNLSELILKTAVQDGKAMQDFESEGFPVGAEHSQKVKAAPTGKPYGSKDCVDLPSRAAVFRMKHVSAELGEKIMRLLNGMHMTSRYPLKFSEEQNPLHLIQLEAIDGEIHNKQREDLMTFLREIEIICTDLIQITALR